MWNILGQLVSPITSLISEGIEDKDKKNEIELKVKQLISDASGRADDYAKGLMEQRASVIMAEANGHSWLQRNWRPLMMLWFAILLGMYWFGFAPDGLTQMDKDNLFSLLKLGIGGYLASRGVEKIVPTIADAIKK